MKRFLSYVSTDNETVIVVVKSVHRFPAHIAMIETIILLVKAFSMMLSLVDATPNVHQFANVLQ